MPDLNAKLDAIFGGTAAPSVGTRGGLDSKLDAIFGVPAAAPATTATPVQQEVKPDETKGEPKPLYTPSYNGARSPRGEWQYRDQQWVKVGAAPQVYAPAKQKASLKRLPGDVWAAVKGLPGAIAGTFASLLEGANPTEIAEKDWKDPLIESQRNAALTTMQMPGANDEYLFGITRAKLRTLPQNLSFSVISLGASLAAAAPAALTGPAAPVVGGVLGAGAGGAAAYRMSANQYMRDVRDSLDQASMKTRGRKLTDDEFIKVADEYSRKATEYGLWEAVPEAVGNVVTLGAGKVVTKAAAKALKASLKKAGLAVVGDALVELGTEAVTQTGQVNVEVSSGIAAAGTQPRSFTSIDDWKKSLGEVAPDVLLLMGVVHGAAATFGRVTRNNEKAVQDAAQQVIAQEYKAQEEATAQTLTVEPQAPQELVFKPGEPTGPIEPPPPPAAVVREEPVQPAAELKPAEVKPIAVSPVVPPTVPPKKKPTYDERIKIGEGPQVPFVTYDFEKIAKLPLADQPRDYAELRTAKFKKYRIVKMESVTPEELERQVVVLEQIVKTGENKFGKLDKRTLNAAKIELENLKAAKERPVTGKKEPEVMDFETFATKRDAGMLDLGDVARHRQPGATEKSRAKLSERTLQEGRAWQERRDAARKEYSELVARGEIRPPSHIEEAMSAARGPDESEIAQAARRVLTKRGIDWRTGEKLPAQPKEAKPKVETKTEARKRNENTIAATLRELGAVYAGARQKVEEAFTQVLNELGVAEAGKRFRVGGTSWRDQYRTMGIPSMFPAWIPEGLRERKLIDTLLGEFAITDVSDPAYPVGPHRVRVRRLFDTMLDEVDRMAGLDTKAVRGRIMSSYAETPSARPARERRAAPEAPAETGGGGVAGGETVPEAVTQAEPTEADEIRTKDIPIPSGFASVGDFVEEEGKPGREVLPAELPELVTFAEELGADVLSRDLGAKKRGAFIPRDKGFIKLHRDLFKPENLKQLLATIAHEIGHMIDWLPDQDLSRGNILGRLYTLHKFLRGTFGSDSITNPEIRGELLSLSEWWRPYDKAAASKTFRAYRNSSKELYADALSVLFNSPGELEARAPKFYETFFRELDRKPEVLAAYRKMQDVLRGGKEVVQAARLEKIVAGFKKARAKRQQIAAEKKGKRSWFQEAMQQHITRWAPIYQRIGERMSFRTAGIGRAERLRMTLEELAMFRNDIYGFLNRINRDVADKIKKAGVDEDTFGALLELDRNLGQRIDIANPGGMQAKYAQELRDFITQKFTPEQAAAVEDAIRALHAEVFSHVEEVARLGIYGEQTFKEKIEPYRDSYVTFAVVDYINENFISAGIKTATGTLKEVENPLVSTVMKTAALLQQIADQRAKVEFVQAWKEMFPSEIEQSEEVRGPGGERLYFKPRKGTERIELREDGRIVGYDVDPYIAKAFERYNPIELHSLLKAARAYNGVFKQLVTTYNLSWGFYSNIIRDQARTLKNLLTIQSAINKEKGISIARALARYVALAAEYAKAYAGSVRSGYRFTTGTVDEMTQEMMANKAFAQPWTTFDPYANEDTSLAPIFDRYNYAADPTKRQPRRLIVRIGQKILNAIRIAGGTFESATKVAGYKVLSRRYDKRQAAMLTRNFIGTPNYFEGGTQKEINQSVFIFSNVILQGLRSETELATNPATRGAYWLNTFIFNIAPKLAMLAIAGGLAGERLKRLLAKATEYDKTNYIVIPVGETKEGKAVYMRIPHDDMGRFYAAMTWKLGSAMQGEMVKPQQAVDVAFGVFPSMTPAFGLAGMWLDFMRGINPYDTFRGRTVLDQKTYEAGGIKALKKMVLWTVDQLGVARFQTYDPAKQTMQEYVLAMTPVANRAFRISDYGETEKYQEVVKGVRSERAKELLRQDEIINKHVGQYARTGKTAEDRKVAVESAVREVFKGKVVTRAEVNRLVAKVEDALDRGFVDTRTGALIDARSVDEQLELLGAYFESLSREEFNRLFIAAQENKVISAETAKKFFERHK